MYNVHESNAFIFFSLHRIAIAIASMSPQNILCNLLKFDRFEEDLDGMEEEREDIVSQVVEVKGFAEKHL